MTDRNETDTALDRALDRYKVAPASAQLRAAILASAPKGAKPGASWIDIMREEIFGWAPALPALVFALALGLAAGLMIDGTAPDDLMQLAEFAQDLEEEE